MTITLQQKIIIGLFAATILFSCLSLVWFQIEKPFMSKVTCEEPGMGTDILYKCDVTPAKDLSPFHTLLVNLAITSGVLFLIAGAYTYITRPRDPLNPPEVGQ